MTRAKIANLLNSLADVVGGVDWQARREADKAANEVIARIHRGAAGLQAEREKETKWRSEKGLLNAQVPDRWRSCYYLQQGYRVSFSHGAPEDHWSGGPPRHQGAVCPVCKKPLLLFWDINCEDPRFRNESPDVFGALTRLPLYYCCRRPEPTSYQVLSPDRIRTFRPDLHTYEETPFSDFPDEFDRRPLCLEPIPRDVANFVVLANDFSFDWLNPSERDRLSEYLDKEVRSVWDLELSQFGGAPRLIQGHRGIDCPNPDCLAKRMGVPVLGNPEQYQMKELAVIDIDSGFEMKTNCAQIAYHICWNCLTIHADYRID
jgi:hypothetical protein